MKRALAALACAAPLLAQPQPAEEVPFITSPDNVTLEMLRIAGVGASDHVIDLGSGDGRIVILAARRFGASGLGVEIDPALVKRSRENARSAGVAGRVEFREQDLFETDLSRATVITMYLLPEVNLQLRPRLLTLKPGTRIVSHDWDMGDWQPDQTSTVAAPDKKVGLDKSSKVHLWIVPARVQGTWCGLTPSAANTLELRQRFQQVEGQSTLSGAVSPLQGRIEGTVLHLAGGMRLAVDGEQLREANSAQPLYRRGSAGRC